jgi:hypothetical protein
MKQDGHVKQVELETGREGGRKEGRASSCVCNISEVMVARRVIYTRWRWFEGK